VSVVLVDWLGRGGIAQTSEAWCIELSRAGVAVEAVTRPGRELGSGEVSVHPAREVPGRIRAHWSLANDAAALVRDHRPDTVVIQNYVLPPLESPVYAAARAVGARVVLVVHDDRLHTWKAGTRAGLRRRLQRADAVVVHSHWVGQGVRSFTGRDDIVVVPHPVQAGMLSHDSEPVTLPGLEAGEHRAGHFGVLRRSYKGGHVVETLARDGVPGWQIVAAGVGAPGDVPGLKAITGYLSPGALTAAVAATDVTLAPYRRATQSGVVVLGHVLGSVPVASAVGGIPEQIDDGVDGVLVAPDAPVTAWRDALARLRDDEHRKELAVAGVARAWRDHEEFVRAVPKLVA
jgi:glycosyltransferase involved in cell wall biosynthesis